MTTEESERLLAACRLLGDHPEEVRLLTSEVTDIRLFTAGTSRTYEVVFADGSRGSFKPIEGVEASASGWGHTATSVILNDYAAWLVARGLGYEKLLGGTVITTSSEAGVGIGSMQCWLEGQASGPGWEQASQLRAAAMFDAVIGQQDRNGSNFVYNDADDELGLFDQSFTFPLPGHNQGASALLAQVHADGSQQLDQGLFDALDRFDASSEKAQLQQILPPDRYARMEARIALMRNQGELLQPGEY